MTNFRDLLKQIRDQIAETTAEELRSRLDDADHPELLDVRELDEVRNGIVPGAKHLSRAHFESRVEDLLPDKGAEVVIYCASGVRSAFAARTLEELGYQNVVHLKGGFNRWKDLGFQIDTPRILDASQRDRY